MSDLQVGTVIGGYEIESLLGRGGMGVVYRARHLRLGRMVALKVLAPDLAADENFRTRFVRESQMAASLDHPNVIPVYDADEIDGVLFLAMRYVEGTDLKKVIESDGALPLDKAVAVLSQIGGALDAAHAKGLIHRDIKPANVLVGIADTGSEHVYLTDFGLTKHSGSKSGLTATGAFVGTIDYIAPEQIEGKTVDARTDVYALGCVLYECLTGKVPFQKDADVAVMYAHLMDPRPKVTDANPVLPAAVDAVVDKAMAREPEDRYPNAASLVADLRTALGFDAAPAAVSTVGASPAGVSVPGGPSQSGASVVAPSPSVPRRFSGKLMTAAGAAVIVIAALAFFLTRDGDEGGEGGPGSSVSGTSGGVFVSPDGSEGAAGTSDDPVASIAEAVAMAEEGGTVTLMDGVYQATTTPMLELDKGVTITAAEDATPVLSGSADHPDGIYVAPGTSGVTIRGLTFEGFEGDNLKFFCTRCEEVPENRDISLEGLEITGGGSPIIIENVDGLTLQRITVAENEHTGFLCSPGPCNNVSIVDSSFHNANQPDATGITIDSGDQVLIETTDASFNAGDGIRSNASSTQVIRSRATNNGDVGMSLTGSDSEVRDSIMAANRNVGLLMGEAGCQGCSSTGAFKAVNILVIQNGIGISVENDDTDEIDFHMFNSILTNNGSTAVQLTGATKIVRFDFNLFNTAGNVAVAYRGREYTENDLNHSRLPGSNDGGTYGSVPVFVGPNDYHLAQGSPGLDGGTQVGVISQVDIDGNPRVSGKEIDVGPYER